MNVQAELAALIEKAEREGKWLACNYQDIWFSPDELRAQNAQGRYLWGVINWKLRDPQERLELLYRKVQQAQIEVAEFLARLSSARERDLSKFVAK